MSLITEWVRYGADGEYRGYAARPAHAGEPLPAVIVLQEIWGVDEHIRDVTERFARAGYVAFAPDLFAENGEPAGALSEERIGDAKRFLNTIPPAAWRDGEKRKEALSALPADRGSTIEETLGQLFDLGGRFPDFIHRITTASAWLRGSFAPSRGRGVASVGFCLGGALSAALAAKDAGLSGAVIFYGNPPAGELLSDIGCPLLGLYGELDKRITDAVPAFAAALEAAGKSFEHRIYRGAQHAFFNDTRPSFHPDAARDAFTRTLEFLQRTLAGEAPLM
ncbi:dienelactone hydrolase family protein [Paenibacillus sp. N4]|uniref:dienelactone hydrolase family protein n=1 Tax=Paenibacillus vietnamensis TaxID=2590547 RepID=UPI001CD15B8E|nr:dienelactone hydrolase family protein [Paenibacillus vietnamensis]MCA0754264.1 dienelactone hydrolase family protein [Paenibacillus vietnamensis]